MIEELITGIVVTELHDELGPNPILAIPSDLSEDIVMSISIKTVSLLTAEQGMIPKSLVIMPFPSLNLKAMIKYIQWKDETKRGGIANSVITFLFREVDDLIFYKYIQDLDYIFNETAKKLIPIETPTRNIQKIEGEISLLRNKVIKLLNEMSILEQSASDAEEFPEEQVDPKEFEDYQFKIVICGDPEVGKTSIVLRLTKKAFKRSYLPTLGINVSTKVISFDNVRVELVLWDIAGQEKFNHMRFEFYKGAKAMLLVFDLTNSNTFSSVKKWFQDVLDHYDTEDYVIGYILGNKSDLVDERKIVKLQANQLANELDLKYFETSALTGENIEHAFYDLAKTLYLKNKTIL